MIRASNNAKAPQQESKKPVNNAAVSLPKKRMQKTEMESMILYTSSLVAYDSYFSFSALETHRKKKMKKSTEM